MDDYLRIMALALLPFLGNLIGGFLAETFPVSKRLLSLALHGAAGVVLAVVGVGLFPQVLQADPPWLTILAFLAGGGFFVLMDRSLDLIRSRFGIAENGKSSWIIYFGFSVDLFTDGLLIGASTALSFGLGVFLGLAFVLADIPQGFATIAAFKRRSVRRDRRLWLSAGFAIPVSIGTLTGYVPVRDGPEIVKLILLAFAAGILLAVAVEAIIPEAHQNVETRLATLAFITGFALFALLSVYFE